MRIAFSSSRVTAPDAPILQLLFAFQHAKFLVQVADLFAEQTQFIIPRVLRESERRGNRQARERRDPAQTERI